MTKSLLCKSAALTGMLYFPESLEYSRVILLNMESLNMTSINGISSRKAISMHQEDSMQFTAQQKSISYLPSRRPRGSVRTPISVQRLSEHLSRHQPQGTNFCTNVWTTQRIATLERFAQVSERQTRGREQWTLEATVRTLKLYHLDSMTKDYWRIAYFEVSCCLPSWRSLSKSRCHPKNSDLDLY